MSKRINLIANLLCVILLFGVIIYLAVRWKSIPSVIPSHYDFAGNADAFGKKAKIWLCPIMAWIIFLAVTAVSRFPQLWNTGVRVTEQNKEAVYGILLTMLNLIKLCVVFVFTYMAVCQAEGYRLPFWFTAAFIAVLFAIIVVSIVKLYKVRSL